MRPDPLSITLMTHPDDPTSPWSPSLVREHLRRLGHRAEVRTTVPRDAEMVHALGIRAAESLVGCVTPWALTPGADVAAEDAELICSATAVLVASNDQATVVNRLGVPHYRISVVPVAVDCETFTRIGPMANRTHRFRVVTRFTGDGDGLLRAVEALRYAPEAELIAVAPMGAEARLPVEAERAVLATGMRARVAVVQARDAGERAWWLRSAHAALTVSDSVADPELVAEAMACGTPVVATLVDAQRELVVHGVTGFHVPSGRPLATAGALREIFADEFSLEAYGMAASDRAQNRLDWPHVARDLAAAYRRAVTRTAAVQDLTDDEDDSGDEPDLVPVAT